MSEALGYRSIAEWYQWWGMTEVRERAETEEYALDSFQNLDFGLRRYARSPAGRRFT